MHWYSNSIAQGNGALLIFYMLNIDWLAYLIINSVIPTTGWYNDFFKYVHCNIQYIIKKNSAKWAETTAKFFFYK